MKEEVENLITSSVVLDLIVAAIAITVVTGFMIYIRSKLRDYRDFRILRDKSMISQGSILVIDGNNGVGYFKVTEITTSHIFSKKVMPKGANPDKFIPIRRMDDITSLVKGTLTVLEPTMSINFFEKDNSEQNFNNNPLINKEDKKDG